MATRTAPVIAPRRLTRREALRASRLAVGWSAAVAALLIAAGVALWWLALPAIDLGAMNDLGLASVLPPATWVAIALVSVGWGVAWRADNVPLMVAGILATILVLFGLGVFGEPTMRFATSWQHVGIADYIATHGTVDPSIDAYFNWPGFFILGAFLSSVAGLDNMEPIARAAPLFYNVMYLLPLVAIGHALFTDRRVVWLGVWLFFVSNWIGQDYYSPQGLGFFLYLVVIAVVLRWFKGMPRSAYPAGRMWRLRLRPSSRFTRAASVPADAGSTGGQRVVLIAAIAMIVVTIVASHQLTPFALIGATAALTVIGWCRIRTLPLAILLTTLLWASYLAVTYLFGHIAELTGDVGAVSNSVGVGVGDRIKGSSGHEAIVKLRAASVLLLWFVAGLGFARRARSGGLVLGLLVLALAPFPLLGLQSYGGEVLLRIGLFTMPFMALAAASLFVSVTPRARISRTALVALACFGAILLVAFPFNRYGNERMDAYSREEYAAIEALYRIAPHGSALFAASYALPWRYRHYQDYYYYSSLADNQPPVDIDQRDPTILAADVARRMRAPAGAASFLVITDSTIAQSDLFGPWKRGAQRRLWRVLQDSPEFRVAYENRDAVVFELR